MSDLTQLKSWLALAEHYDEIKDVHMREMFEEDAGRFEKYSLQINDILYDYSKNRITDETIELLLQLARDAGISDKIEAMFNGEHINHTEDRAVLHTALRDNSSESIMVDGIDVLPEIKAERERVKELAEKIAKIIGFNGDIKWDSSKPDGQPRRCLDVSRAKKHFGFEAKTDFNEGLKATINWYLRSGRV